jgi:hypothetical protein
MKIITEGLSNEMKQDRATEEWRGHLNSKIHETSITWKTLSPIRTNRPSTRGGFAPRGRERGRGPPELTNHNPRDPYFYCQYHGRGHSTEGCPVTKKNIARIQQEKAMMSIASTMPNQLRPSFWQPQFMNSEPSPVTMQQFQQPQPSWQPSQ